MKLKETKEHEPEMSKPKSGISRILGRADSSRFLAGQQATEAVSAESLFFQMRLEAEADLQKNLREFRQAESAKRAKLLDSIRSDYHNLVLGAITGWTVLQRPGQSNLEVHPVSSTYKLLLPQNISLMVDQENLLRIGDEENDIDPGRAFSPNPAFAIMDREAIPVYLPDTPVFTKRYNYWGNMAYFANKSKSTADQFKENPQWKFPKYFTELF